MLTKYIKKIVANALAPITFGSVGNVNIDGYSFDPSYLLGLNVHALQVRAHEIWWKSIHARGAIRQLNVLTVNSGLRLQSQPNKEILDITGDKAGDISNKIESIFGVWRNQKECSFDDTMNFNELESLAKYSWDIFGEFFAILRYSKNSNRFSPLNIQIINPLSVKSPPSIGNKKIKDGIEYVANKPVAIYVETYTKTGIEFKRILFKGAKSGRQVILHGFASETPGQRRGTPKLAPVFHELERIQEALKFEIESMATNASIAIAVERTKPVVDPNKLKAAFSSGRTDNIDPDTLNSTVIKTKSGGHVVQNGEPGETFKSFDTVRPNIDIPEFIRKEMDWIGPAIGLSSELWLMLFGKSYSASKGSIDLTFKSSEQDISKFSASFNQPIYKAVVSIEVACGNLFLTGWSNPRMQAGYLMSRWIGITKPSLNPYQEAKASSERIANKSSNRETESQITSGTSFEVNADRQLREARQIIEIDQLYALSEIDPVADEL